MYARRFTRAAMAAAIAVLALGVSTTAVAAATPEDDQFLDIVEQLDIPVDEPETMIDVGRQICTAVEAGKIEPASTVRGIISRLRAEGLDKGQAVHLVWGAVGVYCPQYNSLVGR